MSDLSNKMLPVVAFWTDESLTRILPKPGDHAGGLRFLFRGRDRRETIVTVLRDETAHGRRLIPSFALEQLEHYLEQSDPPPEQIRQAQDGRFYVPS
jgi:hypothetical protein